jgi:hypothetical protein
MNAFFENALDGPERTRAVPLYWIRSRMMKLRDVNSRLFAICCGLDWRTR